MAEIAGRALVDGAASGRVIKLDEPLSFWGGLDAASGRIVGRHTRSGASIAGRVLVMPSGRGSSSSSSVLAEAISRSTGPVAVVLAEDDQIVALGSLVAQELYSMTCPVVVVSREDLALIPDEGPVRIERGGVVRVSAPDG